MCESMRIILKWQFQNKVRQRERTKRPVWIRSTHAESKQRENTFLVGEKPNVYFSFIYFCCAFNWVALDIEIYSARLSGMEISSRGHRTVEYSCSAQALTSEQLGLDAEKKE